MIIKKFIGKTESEATEAARKELGEGFVVMNVREVKPKGLFAFLKPKRIEVTAALEEERVERPQAPGVGAKPQGEITEEEAKAAVMAAATAAATAGIGKSSIERNAAADSIEKKLESLQTLLENQLKQNNQAAPDPAVASKKTENAKTENGEEERQTASQREQGAEEDVNPEQEKFIRLLYNTMIGNEVDEKYVNEILSDADRTKRPDLPFDYILANIYQKMVLKFGKSDGITPAKKGPKVVCFIGPTGVGKTTTIAKLAGHFVVDEKKKVALLTADTYRIAAAEQLRTYANILEIPFRVIYTPQEFKDSIQAFSEFDYIFVDTAGQSHLNTEQLDKLKELLGALDDVEHQIFLVLSATTKYKDLLKISDSYRKVTESQLIFTKLDETDAQGCLLNLRLYTDTPIAYVTSGQNVPADIEAFHPQKTVKLLLGGSEQ